MDTLRGKIESLFCRGKPKVNVNSQTNEDVQARNLMQQQRDQEIWSTPIPRERQPRYENQTPENMSSSFNLTTADLPVDPESITPRYMGNNKKTINYGMEFVDLINRNAPQGFAQKLHNMLPYMSIGFFSWPCYWIWRGYAWQTSRRTERIGMYIQRTFQNAKLMQVAILGFGLLMASSTRSTSEPFAVHEVTFNSNQKHTQ